VKIFKQELSMNNTMKKSIMLLALAALVAGGVFAQRVGDTGQFLGQTYTVQAVSGDTVTLRKAQGTTFTSIADFRTWLNSQLITNPASPYNVKINISNLGGDRLTSGSLGNALLNNSNKYVNLDLSGSTFTSIVENAFYGRDNLTGITIPSSVTSIGANAFGVLQHLTSVTFLGTIPSSSFSTTTPFPGDLRAKFYAANSTNGTPGTYTTTEPSSARSVWTKQ
jgi:hypothetical protein